MKTKVKRGYYAESQRGGSPQKSKKKSKVRTISFLRFTIWFQNYPEIFRNLLHLKHLLLPCPPTWHTPYDNLLMMTLWSSLTSMINIYSSPSSDVPKWFPIHNRESGKSWRAIQVLLTFYSFRQDYMNFIRVATYGYCQVRASYEDYSIFDQGLSKNCM